MYNIFIFERLEKILMDLQLIFKFLSSLLITGIISASFLEDGYCEKVLASLKVEVRNFVKISIFSLIIHKEISDIQQVFFSLSFPSNFFNVFSSTRLKGKNPEEAFISSFSNTWMIFIFCSRFIIEYTETTKVC